MRSPASDIHAAMGSLYGVEVYLIARDGSRGYKEPKLEAGNKRLERLHRQLKQRIQKAKRLVIELHGNEI